jgi:hypothetical protein
MPSIIDKSTVEAIAREFCSNGRNKTRAMINIGYDEGYSDSGKGHKTVFGNIRIKAAIRAIDAKSAEKQERTVEQLDAMYLEAYELGRKCKQPTAMTGATTGIARLYGMDKDAGIKDELIPKLSEPEIARAKLVTKNLLNTG